MADPLRHRAFLDEAAKLRAVERASVLMDLSRPENSAEHSWHVALQALVFGASARAIRMLLVHDLVEIDVGDQPIHLGHDAAALAEAERQAAARIFGLSPQGDALLALWHEFEAAATPDARMAKRMDHSQPMFQALLAPRPLPDHLQIVLANLTGGRAARLSAEWPEAMGWARAVLDGHVPPGGEIARCLRFLAQADLLKGMAHTPPAQAGRRPENRAERSWHLALGALVLGDPARVDVDRVIRMVLIHDLGAADLAGTGRAEAAARVFGLLPPRQAAAFLDMWHEFDTGRTAEAAFARALPDHLPAQDAALRPVG